MDTEARQFGVQVVVAQASVCTFTKSLSKVDVGKCNEHDEDELSLYMFGLIDMTVRSTKSGTDLLTICPLLQVQQPSMWYKLLVPNGGCTCILLDPTRLKGVAI